MAGFTFFFGLGSLALVGPDEPRYAEVAREMFASGDYISPRLCGCLWFEKPVLLYWLAAGSYHLFGVGEFAARFPSALAALVTTLFLFFAVRRTVSTLSGIIAGLVLATSAIFIGYARAVVTDTMLASTMSIALIAGYLFTTAERRARWGYLSLCSAATGMAVLAKGPVGVFLVVSILFAYLLITRQLSRISWRELTVGALVLSLVVSAWYLPVTIEHGRSFIDEFIIDHHFRRYFTNKFRHPQPFYFYPFVALAGVAPWTFFLMPAIAGLRDLKPRLDKRDSLLAFAWTWAGVPLIFFSFSESKLPGYILPVFPAMAIIIGAEVERYIRSERSGLIVAAAWMTGLMIISIGVAFIVYSGRDSFDLRGWQSALAWLPLTVAVAGPAFLLYRKARGFIAVTSATVLSTVVTAVILLFPGLNNELSLKSLSTRTAAALRPDERIAFYLKKEYAPVFYAEGRVVCDIGGGDVLNALSPDELMPVIKSDSSVVVITTKGWLKDLVGNPKFDTEFIAEHGAAMAIRLQAKRTNTSTE